MLSRVWIAVFLGTIAAAQQEPAEYFEKKIRPVLASRCYACHSASVASPQGGLRLDSASGIKKGGTAGAAVQPGKPEESLLLRAIRQTDKSLKMPPGKPLATEVIADFERWIVDGAVLPADPVKEEKRQKAALWSLKKPELPVLPVVRN